MFKKIFLIASTFLIFIATANADSHSEKKHPKIGLVLEGGGALGFAHFGVIKVLDEEHIPVHIVTGTSMGSIIGAAYASGRTVDEMEAYLLNTDWDKLFNEDVDRSLLSFRLKPGRNREILGSAKVGVGEDGFSIPTALIQGQHLEPLLKDVFGKVPNNISFDDLPVVYRAVSADLETGDMVVLDHGDLATASRASMSVPGVFAPVEIDGRWLVDGGIVNNFPVDIAQQLGAEVIIGVEFPPTLKKRDQLRNAFSISGQILDMMLQQSTAQTMKLMDKDDVLIEPNVEGYGAGSFDKAKELIKIGEDTARKFIPQLKKYSVSEKEYALFNKHRTQFEGFEPTIEFVEVHDSTKRHEGQILQSLKKTIGKRLNRKKVEKQLTKTFNDGNFQKVTYEVVEKDGQKGLEIKAAKKDWMKNYLRIGMALEDDFNGESNYSISSAIRFTDVNDLGAYGEIQADIGRSPRLFTEFYQPLGATSPFFVAPEFSIGRQKLFVRQDDDIIAEYRRQSAILGLKGGVELGHYGEFLAGWRGGDGSLDRQIGEPTLRDIDYDVGEAFTQIDIDTLDSPDFPTRGLRIAGSNKLSRESLNASDDFQQNRGFVGMPFTYNQTTLLLSEEVGYSSDEIPVERYFSFGGFLDISGFENGSLVAADYAVTRATLYHRLTKAQSSFLAFGGFVGGSMELAYLRSDVEELPDNNGIFAGSIFVGADTPFFPIYLGYGMADTSDSSVYLTIGRIASNTRQ